MNTWMIRRNKAKHHYQRKKIFIVTNVEDITDVDYMHPRKVCKNFGIKSLGEYRDLHVQGDTLLLAVVFNNFKSIYLEMHVLDPAHFRSASGLAWQAALKTPK